MPHTLLARTTYAIFLLVCFLSFARGDRWQKLAAVVLLIATVATPAMQLSTDRANLPTFLLLVDLVLLIFFAGIAMVIGRVWMIVAAAFQLLSTLSHPAAHYARAIGPFAYLSVFQLFSYGVYLTLGVAVLFDSVNVPANQPTASNRPSFDA